MGVQVGYALQNANTSRIFQSMGADVSHLSYFWLAAPLVATVPLFVPRYIGWDMLEVEFVDAVNTSYSTASFPVKAVRGTL